MGYPRTLKINLNEYGYYMELDVSKADCNRESAHWHLCKNGRRIGQISTYGIWASYPNCSPVVSYEWISTHMSKLWVCNDSVTGIHSDDSLTL